MLRRGVVIKEIKEIKEETVSNDDGSFEPSSSVDIEGMATTAVNEMVKTAEVLVESDPLGYFLYEHPSEKRIRNAPPDQPPPPPEDTTGKFPWVCIGDFTLNEVINQIRDFILKWELTPSTQYALLTKDQNVEVPRLGKRFMIDALFSKPTPRCPNPLAVATVHFAVHVSALLPKHYPIMVTYKFHGYKTVFYAIGEKSVNSITFQRYYIDSILDMKLNYYSEVLGCANPITRRRQLRRK